MPAAVDPLHQSSAAANPLQACGLIAGLQLIQRQRPGDWWILFQHEPLAAAGEMGQPHALLWRFVPDQ